MHALDPEFSRNLGFYTEHEQQRLIDSKVAIAGAGGDGGLLAVELARMGVGNIVLADPDPFEAENINRQAVCTSSTIGINKAKAVGDYLKDINPGINVSLFEEGVTEKNVSEFVGDADLLIDETEFSMPELGTMLAREARSRQIPNLMVLNVGFGAHITSYHPNGKTFEAMHGLSETATIAEIKDTEVPLTRWLADIPGYADYNAFKKLATGEKSVPTVAPGVAIAAGAGAVQATLHLFGRENHRIKPVYAPKTMVVDVYSGETKIIKHPRANLVKAMTTMAVRSKLGLNPRTSYK